MSFGTYKKMCREMIAEFDAIPVLDIKKPRVGIVGEILVKFSPAANNKLVELLEHEGAEAVVPDLMDFMFYCFYNQLYKAENLGTSKKAASISRFGIKAIQMLRKPMSEAFAASRHFIPPADIYETAKHAEEIVSIGNQTGEGWFLTGEMLELINSDAPNIVCTQPFGCLPNHIVGKGVIKELRNRHPEANIVAIDYDPGASEVNQLNRIKLMLSTAQKNMAKAAEIAKAEHTMAKQETKKNISRKKRAKNRRKNNAKNKSALSSLKELSIEALVHRKKYRASPCIFYSDAVSVSSCCTTRSSIRLSIKSETVYGSAVYTVPLSDSRHR